MDTKLLLEFIDKEIEGFLGEAVLDPIQLRKRDNIDVFLDKVNGGDPFALSPKFFDTFDIDDTLKNHLIVIDRKGKNTIESVKKILQWKEGGDDALLGGLQFETDMVYADDDTWKATDTTILIGLNKLEKTKEFGSRGGDEPKGADWEAILSYVHNGKPEDFPEMATIIKFGKPTQPYIKQAEDMLEDAKNEPGGIWVVTGGGMGGGAKATDMVSSEWKDAFASIGERVAGATATPKTDVKVGGVKMSFKKAGGSQLMSGGRGETMATILAVEKYRKPQTKEAQELLKSFKKSVDENFTRLDLQEKETVSKIQKSAAKAEKQGKKITKTEAIVVAQTLANQEMTRTVKQLFQENVVEINKAATKSANSKQFKFYVCEEALTGNIKFGRGEAAANSLFTFDPSRRLAKYEKINSSVVSKVAAGTEFNVSYKTSGEGGTAWVAMKGVFAESKISDGLSLEESLCQYAIKELNKEFYKWQIIDEAIGDTIGDFAKSAHTKVKDIASSVAEWAAKSFKKVWEKVKEALGKIYEMAKSAAEKGINAYANFFGVEMESAEAVADPDVGDAFLG